MMCRKTEELGIEKKPMPFSVSSSILVEAMFVSDENIENWIDPSWLRLSRCKTHWISVWPTIHWKFYNAIQSSILFCNNILQIRLLKIHITSFMPYRFHFFTLFSQGLCCIDFATLLFICFSNKTIYIDFFPTDDTITFYRQFQSAFWKICCIGKSNTSCWDLIA